MVVSDQQGLSCKDPQKMEIVACTCHDGVVCGALGGQGQSRKDITLGPAAIGLMLLGLLLLLRKCVDAGSDERSHNPLFLLQQTSVRRSFQSRTTEDPEHGLISPSFCCDTVKPLTASVTAGGA